MSPVNALTPTAEELLERVTNGTSAVPDFQRDFRWEPTQVSSLIASMLQNFPAGSLLFLSYDLEPSFPTRSFDSGPEVTSANEVVLDGQQRLTSIFQALNGLGRHRYYLKLQKLDLESYDFEEALGAFPVARAVKKYPNFAVAAADLTFPLALVTGTASQRAAWIEAADQSTSEWTKDELTDHIDAIVHRLISYKFPTVTLPKDTPVAAVCTIFETLNMSGTQLTPFELLTARFYKDGVRLRDLWEEALDEHDILTDFNVDPYAVLQAVSLISKAVCKRGDILDLDASHIQANWKTAARGYASCLRLLQDECGVLAPKWLPYTAMLPPMAATWQFVVKATGPDAGVRKAQLKRWMWCSVFGQTYDASGNSQAAQDTRELRAWLAEGKKAPTTVIEFKMSDVSLEHVTPTQRPMYKGTMALVVDHGARDFDKDSQITSTLMTQGKLDDHHIFPRKFVNDSYDVSTVERDCILNRTLIARSTNNRIKASKPSHYIPELAATIGDSALRAILTSHGVPPAAYDALKSDDFAEFKILREKELLELIRRATVT